MGLFARLCFAALPLSPQYPTDRCSSRDACRECRRNCLKRMPLHSPSCIINKLCSGMTALFCNTPCCSAAILKRIRNGGRRP